MESQIPGSIPRVLPLVGHGQHVQVVEMGPICVTPARSGFGWGRLAWITFEPELDAVVVELLAPQQSGEGLALNVPLVLTQIGALDDGIELICLLDTLRENGVKVLEGIIVRHVCETYAHGEGLLGRKGRLEVRGYLGTFTFSVHPVYPSVDDGIVDAILYIGRRIGPVEQTLRVGVVFGEQ